MTTLFVILAIFLGLAIVFTIAFPIIYRCVCEKKYHEIFGKKLYRLAMHKDYYLINTFITKTRNRSKVHVDHLLFGNKYIYVFSDFYVTGDLYGKVDDHSFLLRSKKRKSEYIDNPLLKAKERAHKLALILNFDDSMFIPIVLVNDACNLVNCYGNKSLIYCKDLRHIIKQHEDDDVKPLNQEQLMYAVHDISNLNERDKKE